MDKWTGEQQIYAHRGASGAAPENTLEAFDLAARMGAQGVELDVHLTRDGELVVTHDETVERVSDGQGWVKDLTLKELKALHFNRTKLGINIELKNSCVNYPDLEKRVIELAAREFNLERVIFSSFNHYSMLKVKQMDPGLICGLLYDATLVRPWAYANALGMDALHPMYTELLIPGGECAAAHQAGVRVHTWTVNEEEDIRNVLLEGADIVITNYPDRALACLRKMKNL